MKILNNNSQVECDLNKSNNNLQKSNKKDPLVEVVNENISKLTKRIKNSHKSRKKVTKEKIFFINDDPIIKGWAWR